VPPHPSGRASRGCRHRSGYPRTRAAQHSSSNRPHPIGHLHATPSRNQSTSASPRLDVRTRFTRIPTAIHTYEDSAIEHPSKEELKDIRNKPFRGLPSVQAEALKSELMRIRVDFAREFLGRLPRPKALRGLDRYPAGPRTAHGRARYAPKGE
jgi:hypothetical protein